MRRTHSKHKQEGTNKHSHVHPENSTTLAFAYDLSVTSPPAQLRVVDEREDFLAHFFECLWLVGHASYFWRYTTKGAVQCKTDLESQGLVYKEIEPSAELATSQ